MGGRLKIISNSYFPHKHAKDTLVKWSKQRPREGRHSRVLFNTPTGFPKWDVLPAETVGRSCGQTGFWKCDKWLW